MGKKCIPGLFCVENMTLFILFIVGILLIYAFYKLYKIDTIAKKNTVATQPTQVININNNIENDTSTFDNGIPPQNILAGISLPPVVGIGYGGNAAVVPINIETRPSSGYRFVQVGILEKGENDYEGNVLPLMGRRLTRNKWQYYAVSNSHLNIKLPIKINGKSGSQEYGCDELMNGDNVSVAGYGNYRVNIYDGANYHYL